MSSRLKSMSHNILNKFHVAQQQIVNFISIGIKKKEKSSTVLNAKRNIVYLVDLTGIKEWIANNLSNLRIQTKTRRSLIPLWLDKILKNAHIVDFGLKGHL